VGRVTRPHGVRGEVGVQVLSEVEGRFDPGAVLHLADGRTLTVSAARPHRGTLLVRFDEVPDRTAARTLAGAYLFVPATEVPPPPDGSFWPHELEGCETVTEEGRSLGRIVEIIAAPANDVWVARDGDRETLIPALRDVVVSVDVGERRVVVREVPGITFDRDE
jgi:16S rRNA processing protein RimM